MRASLSLVVDALDEIRGLGHVASDALLDERDDETPAFGTRLLRATRRTRRTREYLEGPPSVVSRRGFTLPPLESPVEPSEPPIPLVHTTMAPGPMVPTIPNAPKTPAYVVPSRTNRDSEPVLKLVKQKPSMAFRVSVPPPPRGLGETSESPEITLDKLSEAHSPNAAARTVCKWRCMRPLLVRRSSQYEAISSF